MTLRVGIIGAGQVGERHAAGFAAIPGAGVTAVADLIPARAEALAGRYGARAFTDWRAMLAAGLDIVVVCTPHSQHVAPAEAAAARGIHVLMEKPIATTLADGRRIVVACERHGVCLSISFVHRFRDELQTAHDWITSGVIGQPLVASEIMNARRGTHLGAWVNQRELAGGGVLMYSAIHAVDRLRWLLGSEITSVVAHTRRFDPGLEVEDGVGALLGFANGASATLTSTAPTYRSELTHWMTEIHGTAGMLRVMTRQWAEISSDQLVARVETLTGAGRHEHYNFVRQAAAFVAAVDQGTAPVISGVDGLQALAVALAIYRSAASGMPETPEHV